MLIWCLVRRQSSNLQTPFLRVAVCVTQSQTQTVLLRVQKQMLSHHWNHWTIEHFLATTPKEMPKLAAKIDRCECVGNSQPTTVPPPCASESSPCPGFIGGDLDAVAGAPGDVWAAGSAEGQQGHSLRLCFQLLVPLLILLMLHSLQ